jgi:hypothetical protein
MTNWTPSTHWDHAIPTSIPEVIALLERRIEVHAKWLDWFENGPSAETARATEEGVGCAASQRAYIAQYRGAIAALRDNTL